MYRIIIILLTSLVLSPDSIAQDQSLSADRQKKPLNIILLIGDGMGVSQVSLPYYYMEKEPVFSRFEYIGLAKTSSATDLVTMSSAAATALSTGVKTYNYAVGVDRDTVPRENFVELVSKLGYLTGIISTSSITDATPAGFYAHVPNRYLEKEIAIDLLESEIDFFAGGGLKYFIDTTRRDRFKENNIQADFSKLRKIRKQEPGKRYGFILAMDRMKTILGGRGDFLPDASEIAIDFLSQNEKGFFLMIEGSQIDGAGHSNNADYMVAEMIDFEKAVRTVYDFAEKEGNTLVIVTADHETGGFTLSAADMNGTHVDYSTIQPTFATTNHSATLVPVFAFGPGAESFTGIYENNEIFHKMIKLVLAE